MVELKGSLGGIGLPAMIQLIGELHHSGLLELTSSDSRAELGFDDGRLVSASFGSARGLKALAACSQQLATADFRFVESPHTGERNIDIGPAALATYLHQLTRGEVVAEPVAPQQVQQAVNTPPGPCPALGFADDPARHYSRPTALHRCFATGTGGLVSGQEQRELCLSGRYSTCPRFRSARTLHVGVAEDPVAPTSAAPAAPGSAAPAAPGSATPTALRAPSSWPDQSAVPDRSRLFPPSAPEPRTARRPPLWPAADPPQLEPEPQSPQPDQQPPRPSPASDQQSRQQPPAAGQGAALQPPASDQVPALQQTGPEQQPPQQASAPEQRAPLQRSGLEQRAPQQPPEPAQGAALQPSWPGQQPPMQPTGPEQRLPVQPPGPSFWPPVQQTGPEQRPTGPPPASEPPRIPARVRARLRAASQMSLANEAPAAGGPGAVGVDRQAPPGVDQGMLAGPDAQPAAYSRRRSLGLLAMGGLLGLVALAAVLLVAWPTLQGRLAQRPSTPSIQALDAGPTVARPTPSAIRPTDAAATGLPPTDAPTSAARPALVPTTGPQPSVVRSSSPAATSPGPAASVLPSPGLQPTSATVGQPLLDAVLSSGPRPEWLDNPPYATWSDGAYRLLARQIGLFVAVGVPLSQPLSDVVVSATFRKTAGPPGGGYGLIVRDQGPAPRDGQNQTMRAYVLETGDKGEFGVWRRDSDRWVDLVSWTPSTSVRAGGSPNDLMVRAVGPRLSFIINGIEVATVEDTTLPSGGVGVFAGGDNNEVALDRFTVQIPN